MFSGALHMDCILVEFAQHYRALQGSDEDRGTGIPIHLGSNFMPLDTLVDDTLNGSSQNIHRTASTVTQHRKRIISLDGCIEDRATTDKHGIFQKILKVGDNGKQALNRVIFACQCAAYTLL